MLLKSTRAELRAAKERYERLGNNWKQVALPNQTVKFGPDAERWIVVGDADGNRETESVGATRIRSAASSSAPEDKDTNAKLAAFERNLRAAQVFIAICFLPNIAALCISATCHVTGIGASNATIVAGRNCGAAD